MAEQPGDWLDTHFEVALDDEPEPTREPVYVDVVTRQHERRPILPASLRRHNLRATARYHAGRTGYRALYHASRSPRYALLAAFWACVGVLRLIGRQLRWWWHPELHTLLQHAASTNDIHEGRGLQKQLAAGRLYRGYVLLAELLALVVALPLLVLFAPWWLWAALATVAVPLLARIGRPVDQRILQPAIVQPRYRKVNADVVLAAYYAAGLGRADREDKRIGFGSTMARDGDGSAVEVILPLGATFADAMNARPKIASGLDVLVQQVFLRPGRSERRHRVWISDVDPLAIPAGPTPLLDGKMRDVWTPAPLGLDERGRAVTLLLLWNSILVGAQPRKGKTFTARLLALYAALDPYVEILVADGKNSPDWDKFTLVARRMVFGTHPNPRSRTPIDDLISMLEEVAAHIRGVNDFLSGLPASECPEGKLTRDIARRYAQARVWLLVLEEFQVYFETEDQDTNKRIAQLLAFIIAVGPSAGVILLSSSQKPSGVGAGDVQRLFNRYRDNHAVRIALKCGSRQVSEAVLGGDAYQEGFDASALPSGLEYRGVGLLYGASDETPTTRFHFASAVDAERILLAARAHRQRLGTLTGEAAGDDAARLVRDVLRDVQSVFRAGEAWVSWQQLAARLAEEIPEHYGDVTAEAISAQVRALGAAPKKGRQGDQTLWGVPRVEVEQAAQRREIGDGR